MNPFVDDIERLLALAKQGDQRAYGELLERLRGFLRMLARQQMDVRVAGRVDASDIVQQTYIAAITSFHQFNGTKQAEFLTWLRTIHDHVVQNIGRQHVRTQKRTVKRESDVENDHLGNLSPGCESTPSHKLMKIEAIVRLSHCLAGLPSDQSEAVRLRYLEALSLAQIAERMQRSKQSVAGLLKRGLQALRNELGSEVLM
jgi:RNA polymerase sigma-70 factor (ECF subfamily)